MAGSKLHNYIRTHRRMAGLSQRELGHILGHKDDGPVSRHERSRAIPPLLTALAYEAIFHVPVGELFPGVMDAVGMSVEDRIREFKRELEDSSARGSKALLTAQKLEWICGREVAAEA